MIYVHVHVDRDFVSFKGADLNKPVKEIKLILSRMSFR